MKKIWISLPALAMVVVAAGCGGSGRSSESPLGNRALPSSERVSAATKAVTEGKGAQVTNGGNDFGFRLFQELWKGSPDRNLFFSPASVSLALGMTYNGSAGETKQAMGKCLGVKDLDLSIYNKTNQELLTVLQGSDPKATTDIANSIWIRKDYPVNREFMAKNEEFFGAKIMNLDFSAPEAAKTINDWVKEATREKIPSIIDRINPDDRLFLINAIHFDGKWSKPFKADATESKDFTAFNGKKAPASMMNMIGEEFPYYENKSYSSVKMNYGDGNLCFIPMLPKAGTKIGDMIKNLDRKAWKESLKQYRTLPGTLSIPKFESDYSKSLKDALAKLGMSVAFDPKTADFSGVSGNKELFIADVLHKALVKVDESGTEAAAVTAPILSATAVKPEAEKPFNFVADRPFVYVIYNQQADLILFMGVYGGTSTTSTGAKEDGK